MAITFTEYNGVAEGVDGSQTLFGITFEYIDSSHIKVSINGVETTEYILANATQIQFNTAPASGATVRIERVTPSDSLNHEFFSGSAIKAKNLNENFEQTLFIVQETVEAVASSDAGTLTTQINEANTNATNAIGIANGAVTTANGFAASIDTANTTAQNAVNTADAANSTAITASGVASTAQTAADAAQSSADTAQSEVDAVELRVDQTETEIATLKTKTDKIITSTSAGIQVDGYVKTSTPVAWYGKQSTEQSFPTGAWTRMNNLINVAVTTTGWDGATGRFTVPAGKGGLYFLFASVGVDDINSNDYIRIGFSKNRANPSIFSGTRVSQTVDNQVVDVNTHMILRLEDGDEIEVRAQHNRGGAEMTEASRTWFGGYRIT